MPSTLVLSDIGDETWGAVLEDGLVVELHVENTRRPGIAGNIYKGRVSRVLPGMQSAFVSIGLEKDAFLHVADLPAAAAVDLDFEADEDEPAEGAETAESAQDEASPALRRQTPPAARPIEEFLREGQEILVQIVKEPIAGKGPRASALIALPGRMLVHLPFMDRVFVSRRIEDPAERERLTALAGGAGHQGGGWIVRTAAEGVPEGNLTRDAAYLSGLWAAIRGRERTTGSPALLHRDLDLAERLHRDVVSEEFLEVIVDSDRLARVAGDSLSTYLTGTGVRMRRVGGEGQVLDDLGIHQEIGRALGSRISLKSGGSIVVNPTEALVAIDVNTGRYVGKRGLEETVLQTNLEAVREIVRLLRLRDLGGIIVIDFIDMVEPQSRETLSRALVAELRKDRSRTKLLAMNDFGLVHLTRKRTRRSLDRALRIPCPECDGSGRIRSAIALYYEIQRELARGGTLSGAAGPSVRLHPEAIARLVAEGLRPSLAGAGLAADRRGGGPVREPRLVPDPSLPEDRFEIRW